MSKKEKKRFFEKTMLTITFISLLSLGFYATMISQNIQDDPPESIEEVIKDPRRWMKAPMTLATNNTVGSGTAGIVDIYILNDAFSGWNNPIDHNDANIYEETDGTFTDNALAAPHEALSGTTPYETDFHICVVYQFTESMAKDGGSWNASRVKAVMNTTGCQDGDASTVWMSEGSWYAGDDATTQRLNFYLLDIDGGADDGTAFQVAIDSTFNANCSIYYYG